MFFSPFTITEWRLARIEPPPACTLLWKSLCPASSAPQRRFLVTYHHRRAQGSPLGGAKVRRSAPHPTKRFVRINRVADRYGRINESVMPLNNKHACRDQRTRPNYPTFRINKCGINELLLYKDGKNSPSLSANKQNCKFQSIRKGTMAHTGSWFLSWHLVWHKIYAK